MYCTGCIQYVLYITVWTCYTQQQYLHPVPGIVTAVVSVISGSSVHVVLRLQCRGLAKSKSWHPQAKHRPDSAQDASTTSHVAVGVMSVCRSHSLHMPPPIPDHTL